MQVQTLSPNPLRADPADLAYIFSTVEHYRLQLIGHPLAAVLAGGRTPRALIHEFASLQYVACTMWIPILAMMKDRVSNHRLRGSLTDNLMSEAGVYGPSHVALCQSFIQSLGLSPFVGDFNVHSTLARQPVEIMNSVSGLSEAQIAGVVLATEGVVPSLYAMALPALSLIEGVDLRYLLEHVGENAEDNLGSLKESIEELLVEGAPIADILEGIHLGGRAALSAPDSIYSKYVRRAYR